MRTRRQAGFMRSRPMRPPLRARSDRQRRLTAQAREAEQLKAAVFQAALNAVLISDVEGRVLEVNPAAETLFGRSAAEAVALFVSDFLVVPPQALHAAGHRDGNVLGVLGQRVVLDGVQADGRRFPAEVAVQRVALPTRTLFAAFVRDMTAERRAAADLEDQRHRSHQFEKMSAMSSLLGGVAHELNNPLAILVTQATLLREKAPTPDVERRAERIHAAAQRAGRIVKGFLAMASQKPPAMEALDLGAVIDQALELVGYGLRSAGVAVERRLDPALPAVRADRGLMGQVLANLLLNAQEAMVHRPLGERRLVIRTVAAGDLVVVEVEDSGPGVPDAIAGRIFEPYFTTKPPGSGTGIGLSLCRSVVEAHEGTIECVPVSRGALFRVTLRHGGQPAASPASVVGKARALSVLVVDDEIEVAQSLAELIELFGHRVRVESSARQALDRVGQGGFDMVFTDFRMPEMDGAALRDAIGRRDPTLVGRVVIVTGDTVSGLAAAAGDGRNFVLDKPFTAADVRALLDQVPAA